MVKTNNEEIDVVSCLKEINIIYEEHVISYCYDRQKTVLNIFEQEDFEVCAGRQHTLEIPLLDLNLKNPKEVVERIKKLHLFT